MDRMKPVIFHPKKPFRRPTEEELKEADSYWDMLCAGKTVCITDPSKSGIPDKLSEKLKDRNCKSSFYIDSPGDIPNEEFYRRLMNGEYDDR